jgi:hypothetical protein
MTGNKQTSRRQTLLAIALTTPSVTTMGVITYVASRSRMACKFVTPAIAMISIALLVVAIITPFVLIVANLVLLAKYIDPQHAAGHYVAKFFLVMSLNRPPKSFLSLTEFWNLVLAVFPCLRPFPLTEFDCNVIS